MSRDRTRETALERDAAASARNAKQIVERTPGPLSPSDRHWQRVARKLFEKGFEERAVMEALRQQGALAYMAAAACEAMRGHYRNVHHMAHRKDGLRGVIVGACMCAIGAALVLLVHLVAYGGGLFLAGAGAVVFGLYKVLTGSSMPVMAPGDEPF